MIEIITKEKENSCNCDICKNMCKTVPCLGTPKDISLIFLAGLGNKLTKTGWAVGLIAGTHDHIINMIQPKFENGRCAFLNEKDLCQLHDLNLKPTEGKLSNHNNDVVEKLEETVNFQIANMWDEIKF